MKKQTILLLSTLVLTSVVSIQPANAFNCCWLKKAKPAIAAPVKEELVPVKSVVKEEAVKKETAAVKTVPTTPAKPVVKTVTPATAVKLAQKPAAKATVKK